MIYAGRKIQVGDKITINGKKDINGVVEGTFKTYIVIKTNDGRSYILHDTRGDRFKIVRLIRCGQF